MLSGTLLVLLPGIVGLLGRASGKWVEGHIDTKQNWAFLSRFCFLSLDGQFEYLIEFNRDMGIPNLLLYYDDQSQWPSVYHSQKSCKEKEAVLNKAGQNQIIKLSHWYPEMEFSGCVLKREDKELPASKSSSTTAKPTTKLNTTTNNNKTTELSPEPSYYDQFLKTTTNAPKTTTFQTNSPTTWYDVTIEDNVNTTELPDEEFWESIGNENNNDTMESLKDVEILFSNSNADNGQKIKRSTFELYERYKRRRLSAETAQNGGGIEPKTTERIIVSCHNARRFRSSRERWWFIAISNCDSPKGLDVKYKFLMTNGPEGDFWHLHFSADEFYVLPVLLAYVLAYVVVMIAVVMCSVELKSRHLLHATYKLFLVSVVVQHFGVVLQALAFVKYASNGINYETAKTMGQFFCGLSEMSFLLLLILMAKGYTITRGRLKVGFTVKLTVFMCCYCVTYIILFVYQAKAFDPGEVLYLYESPPGYGLIVLRIAAWSMFAYSTFFTVKKYPEKNMFYGPFFICGSMWFYAGPLFILTANSYIDKWVRESVVIAVLLFITFCGHIMFLLLTLPVFANKNFPYHVRTTQIGVMEVTGSRDIDGFGHNAYHPANGTAQTVIIPLTRRTEELIGNMYNQYMATAPPISLEDEIAKQNGGPKSLTSISPQNKLIQQDSTDTNTSEDIMPSIPKHVTETTNDNKIFTIDGKINEIKERNGDLSSLERKELPTVLRSKRNILEPINKNGVVPPPPSWSLAKGPASVAKPQIGENFDDNEDTDTKLPPLNPKKVPSVRNGLQNSTGEISTILEGHVQDYSKNTASKATIDLFNVKNK